MISSLSKNPIFFTLVIMVAPAAQQAASAAGTVVWKIGNFDHSSAEFSRRGLNGSGSHGRVVYAVGKSTPSVDWPASQPGSLNDQAGRCVHPYSIEFNLPDAPLGLYTLKIGLIASGDSVLEVDINGHRGLAYQHPQLNRVWLDALAHQTRIEGIEIELPLSAFRKGRNSLVLTAIDPPRAGGKTGDSALIYDALELDQDSGLSFIPGKESVIIEPTIFYEQKNGQLVELIEAYIWHNCPLHKGRVDLIVGAKRYSADLMAGHDFGEERVEFALPEFAIGTRCESAVTIDDSTSNFRANLTPAKKWKLLLIPHEHLDVGYNYSQGKVAEIQSRALDEAMDLIHDHPDFRYSVDAFWVFQKFLAGRDAEDQQRLLSLAKEHKVLVPAQYANLLTECTALETLVRSLYPTSQFDRKNGLNFDYANLTDVPSAAWSYPSILAAADLKYLVMGSDPIRGPILPLSDLQERSPFWWEGPDGGRILTWYSWSYGQMGIFGSPSEVQAGRDNLPGFLASYTSPVYKADTVIMFGSQGENSDLYPQQASIVEQWNKIYAYPKLCYSDVATALGQIAGELGDSMPVIRGDGGPYWEDGIYSDTQVAILARENELRATSAEKISTISSIVRPHVRPDSDALNKIWQNIILFDEHTWGAALGVSNPESMDATKQAAAKKVFATNAAEELDQVLDRGMVAIGDRIDNPQGTWIVFNPLSWRRSGWVELDLEKGLDLVDPTTGRSVPYEILSEHPNHISLEPLMRLPTILHIRFIAQDVPALGYKCYRKQPQAAEAPGTAAYIGGTLLENSYYRVVVDPESGAVSSIFDKELNRELVNASSPYRFNEFLYVTGGDKPSLNRLIYSDFDLPLPALTIHLAHAGHVRSIERTPFGSIAHLVSSDTNSPHIETDVILFDAEKKIEFVNRVRKDMLYEKEAVYFAFPFAMDSPEVRYDSQMGVIDPVHDLLPGAAREWFSLQHWVSVGQSDLMAAIVPVDAGLFTLDDIVRGKWPKQLSPPRGTIFSYVMNNYWFTNYVAGQGGDYTFRYFLTSARKLAPGQLARWGWEEMTPMEASEMTEVVKNDRGETTMPRPLNPSEESFLHVEPSNVILVNWKMAEDGNGTILRFLEIAGRTARVNIQIPILELNAAWMCNSMEENQRPLPLALHGLSFPVRPFQLVTVRIKGVSSLH